jgi:hypothetical protein
MSEVGMSKTLTKNAWRSIVGAAVGLWFGTYAQAAVFSFNGSFTADDNEQFLSFTQGSLSPVTLQTSSYAAGGFDPIVAVFDATGLLVAQNDDGFGVAPDPSTGEAFDSLLALSLDAGQYLVSLTEFDNFALGPALSDGFVESGQGNFTALFACGQPSFCDVTGSARTNKWALTISGEAVTAASTIPEPTTSALLMIALAWLGVLRVRILWSLPKALLRRTHSAACCSGHTAARICIS